MTIQQIRYALKTAETGSVCSAARMLGVRQPSISSAIVHLEQEMHIVIFERNSKGMILTDAGQAFLDEASVLERSFGQLESRYGICNRI